MKLSDGRYRFRRRSINSPGHAHELTFTCFHGLPLLSRERTRQWLVDAIDRARTLHDYSLWAYVIMPDHVHLLIRPNKQEYQIAGILKSIKQSVSRKAIAYLCRDAPNWLMHIAVHSPGKPVTYRFWQRGGGYDRNIIQSQTLLNALDYIHANPVRRGLVSRPDDWVWSSAGWYGGGRNEKLSIDPITPEFCDT